MSTCVRRGRALDARTVAETAGFASRCVPLLLVVLLGACAALRPSLAGDAATTPQELLVRCPAEHPWAPGTTEAWSLFDPRAPQALTLENHGVFGLYGNSLSQLREDDPEAAVAEWDLPSGDRHFIACKYAGIDALLVFDLGDATHCSHRDGLYRCSRGSGK
jgi:hypothetical protein